MMADASLEPPRRQIMLGYAALDAPTGVEAPTIGF